MNLMIYFTKKNFDVQKAERFLKERRVPFTEVDLKKHVPGKRELDLFVRCAGGARALVDPDVKSDRADYVRHLTIDSIILEELEENPGLIRGPIVRCGNKAMFGFDPVTLDTWIKEDSK